MAQPEYIYIGPPNADTGDSLYTAFTKSNSWFGFLNSRVQTVPPVTLVGSNGDEAGMYAYDSSYFYYCFADYDGSSTIWAQVSQVGNVSLPLIINGTTEVNIPNEDGNVVITVNNTANVAVITTSGIDVSGTVTADNFVGSGLGLTGLVLSSDFNTLTANYLPTYTGALHPGSIFTNNYYYANGVPFTGSGGGGGGSYGDSNVAAYLPTYTGNIGGTLINSVQPNITQLGTLAQLTVNGINDIDFQAIAANITIATTFGGIITIAPSGVGSIDNMVIGATQPQAATFTNVSAANVTATYFIGDGSLLTNISGGGGSGNYGNSNVAAYLPTYTGNVGASNVNVTGTTTSTHITGQLTGTVNGVNLSWGIWDFGSITGNTFNSPIAWIFSQTSAGNIDMGTIASPSSNEIDIGTIY